MDQLQEDEYHLEKDIEGKPRIDGHCPLKSIALPQDLLALLPLAVIHILKTGILN